MMPTEAPRGSNEWKNGVDEFGRVWKNGTYVRGVVDTETDLLRYSPPLDRAEQYFDRGRVNEVKIRYPDHCLIFGTHVGPFMSAYLSMGFEHFFSSLLKDTPFVRKVLDVRTEWCIAMYRKAIDLGAEIVVLGDDAGHRGGPMIPPRMWRELVLPYQRRIIHELDVPVIWHSDGNIEPLLSMAIDAGFAGIHGLEPAAGIDLAKVKREFGQRLVLVGNIDVRVLFNSDLDLVRREVNRCIEQGAPGGRYMIGTCNIVYDGMNSSSVSEMFRYEGEVGFY
jgi:uroporphyrinogen decarboxylase